MADAATFLLDIVTPERKIFSGNVEFAIFPGADGFFGILPHHAAMISVLIPGEIKISYDQKSDYFTTSGGFLEVAENKVIVIADTAETSSGSYSQQAK